MLIPNSAASKIIGRDGCHAREMAQQIGCRTSISRRNPGEIETEIDGFSMVFRCFQVEKRPVDLNLACFQGV